MIKEFKIHSLLEKAFDIAPYIHPGISIGMQVGNAVLSNQDVLDGIDPKRMISSLGTPILYPFTLKGGKYKVYNNKGVLEEKDFDDFMMPVATMVDFSRSMNLKETPVLGGRGTVKELFGFKDWEIKIRGICFNDFLRLNKQSAVDQRKELINWAEIAGSIRLSGKLFKNKGIDEIILKTMAFKQQKASSNMMPFQITAISNTPVELIHKI